MSVSIVIPNWNGADKLRRNLPKVLKVKGVSEVIVVDDASEDDGVDVIKKEFPQVRLIEKRVNSRFADTVNRGVNEAKGDLVFLINNDASPEPDALEKAVRHFKDPKVFSVSCNSGGNWSWARFKDGYFWHYMHDEKTNRSHQTLWASGGSGIFRKSIWNQLGGLDTLFAPFYEEDSDLGYRATKRGYINIFESASKVEHYKEQGVNAKHFSAKFISRIAQRNQLLFIWKNITDQDLIEEHMFALLKMLLTHPKYWLVFLSAVVKIVPILEKRREEESSSIISDKKLLSKFHE